MIIFFYQRLEFELWRIFLTNNALLDLFQYNLFSQLFKALHAYIMSTYKL